MSFTIASTSGSAVALVVAIVLGAALLAGPAGAATAGMRCARRVDVGHAPGITLRAFGLRTDLTCPRAHAIVLTYLQRKLRQGRTERCAARAAKGVGCIVDGYRCRQAGRPRLVDGRVRDAQLCTRATRVIHFTESDRSAS